MTITRAGPGSAIFATEDLAAVAKYEINVGPEEIVGEARKNHRQDRDQAQPEDEPRPRRAPRGCSVRSLGLTIED